jgi:hypothetical protein
MLPEKHFFWAKASFLCESELPLHRFSAEGQVLLPEKNSASPQKGNI